MPVSEAETLTKIWMNGLNPNYNTTRPNSGLNLRNCCRNVRARDSLLSFATPSWFRRSHQGVHPPPGHKLKLQQILFYVLMIHLSLYSVLISFAHNLHYKMLWVCSLRPLELHFVHAWDCCQQDAAALADQHDDCKVRGNY